jgi:hypothetical protein
MEDLLDMPEVFYPPGWDDDIEPRARQVCSQA